MSQYWISTVLTKSFAHRSYVILFTKITLFPYFDKVQDIELYGSSVVDDLDAN